MMTRKEKRNEFISDKTAQGMSKTQAKNLYSGKSNNRPKSVQNYQNYKGSENDGINIDRSSNSVWQDYAHTSDDI